MTILEYVFYVLFYYFSSLMFLLTCSPFQSLPVFTSNILYYYFHLSLNFYLPCKHAYKIYPANTFKHHFWIQRAFYVRKSHHYFIINNVHFFFFKIINLIDFIDSVMFQIIVTMTKQITNNSIS